MVIECGEHQHNGYNKLCEDGRMDEIIDEFKEGRIIFIRWNPDGYKKEKESKCKSRKEKLFELQSLIKKLSTKEWTNDDPFILVYYMYYSKDNSIITNRFYKEIIN